MARIRAIKPDEAAELRGFFFGEGHLDLVKQGRTTRGLSPRARIALRADDLAILRWMQERFGGALTERKSTRSWCWQLTGKKAVSGLIACLEGGAIPTKKRPEIELVKEALTLVSVRGRHLSDEAVARLHAIKSGLIRCRRFSGAN